MTSSLSSRAPEGTSGVLYFGVDARHVRQLGRELVGDRVTALVELVKNAYDADATEVSLKFLTSSVFLENPDQHGDEAHVRIGRVLSGQIEVHDNGAGMSLEDLAQGWMRIAGDAKERNPRSPKFGRARSGRKGIGRFAAESLGEHLTLWTTQAGSDTGIEVKFDWMTDYESGQDLQTVGNSYEVLPAEKSEHGTVLRIAGLHSAWTNAQRSRVARALLLLQPPFPVSVSQESALETDTMPDPGFRVQFTINGIPEKATSVEGFLEGETAHIEAEVLQDGSLKLRVRSQLLGIDREEILSGKYLVVGPLTISASYFIYLAGVIGVPLQAARDQAQEYGGTRIYRDGMRLLPYGETNNDWLGLDEKSRRRTYLNPIGNQNFFAQVLISREHNPFLVDTSSREGLIENEAYEELVACLNAALITASVWVAEHRERRGKGGSSKKPPRPSRAEIVADAAAAVRAALAENLPNEQAKRAASIVDAALDVISQSAVGSDTEDRAEIQQLQNEIELLRVLASLGTSISVFSHEVRSVLIAAAKPLVALQTKTVIGDPEKKSLALASRSVKSLGEIANYIDSFTGGARLRSRVPQPMSKVLKDFVSMFAEHLAKGTAVTFSVEPPSLRTAPIGATALQAILINLFTNAIKAVDKEGAAHRAIDISARASSDGSKITLTVSDTGSGIDPAIANTMFDAFVTTRPAADAGLGVGTGLGLKVVADLAEEYGGSVGVVQAKAGYSTSIQLVLPRWKDQL